MNETELSLYAIESERADNAIKRAEAAEARAADKSALIDTIIATWEPMTERLLNAEAERDETRRKLREAQTAIDAMAQIVGNADTVRHQLEQARSDIEDYRAEIARLHQAAATPKHTQEALNEGDGAYRP